MGEGKPLEPGNSSDPVLSLNGRKNPIIFLSGLMVRGSEGRGRRERGQAGL